MTHTIAFPGLGIGPFTIQSTFELFGLTIHWYGIIIALGIVLAYLFVSHEAKKKQIGQDTLLDLIIFGLPSAIIGARLYYVIFSWDEFQGDWLSIFRIWEGGLAIYGGIIGACISTYIYCRVKKLKIAKILDLGAFGLLIGQAIGRWGNFVNAEAYGEETAMPWGMELVDRGITVHPTFLYESLWNAGVFLFLLWFRKRQKFDGEIFLVYLVGYGIGRFFIEGLRTDSLWLGPFRISQLVAFVCVAVGLFFIFFYRSRIKKYGSIEKPEMD